MKYLIFMFAFFLYQVSFASNCCQPNCPEGIKYPYKFCNINGKMETICTDDPNEYERIHKDELFVRRAILPISITNIGGNRIDDRHYIYSRGDKDIILFNEGNNHLDAWSEFMAACDEWNCVCGIGSASDFSGTCVWVEFTDDPKDFNNPKKSAAATKVNVKPDENGNGCYVYDYESRIYFNITPKFLYGTEKFPEAGVRLKQAWVGQEHIDNVKEVPNEVNLYSFQQVAMHEIGHMLGFDHYNDELGVLCDNTLDGIMKYNVDDIRKENIISLSASDKCMFQKLYCPIINCPDAIYEYQTEEQTVYPNPGEHMVSIDFILPKYCENVKISLKDVLGQTVLVPVESTVLEAGKHTKLINVEALSNGIYYIIIEACTHLKAQSLTIIR